MHGGRHERRAARPAARADLLARGRRAVRHAAARLHRAPATAGHGRNLGMYRMQVHDPRTTGMHWQIGKGGGFHYAAAEARGEALPVTVFLGGPPALMLAAIAPLPENVPELLLASLLAGERLARCARPGPAPARRRAPSSRSSAACRRGERAARGAVRRPLRLLLAAPRLPGLPGRARCCRRRDAIYPATVVGKPRQEDFFIGDLLQELLSPLFPLVMPGVRGALVVRRDRLPLARRRRRARALHARGDGLGLPHPRRGPALADEVPARHRPPRRPARLPRDARARARAHAAGDRPLRLRRTCRWTRSTTPGPRSTRARRACGSGSATRCASCRASSGRPSRRRATSRTCASSAAAAWSSAAPPREDDPGAAARLAAHPAFRGWPLVVLTDEPKRAAASAMNFLWTTFTRFEPAADIHAAATRVVRHHVRPRAAGR